MAEYIDRVALENAMTTAAVTGKDRDRRIWAKAICVLHDMPTSDVAPVRHAKWVDNHCTACGMMPIGDEMWKNHDCEPPLFERFMDYCPNCGAKMESEG